MEMKEIETFFRFRFNYSLQRLQWNEIKGTAIRIDFEIDDSFNAISTQI